MLKLFVVKLHIYLEYKQIRSDDNFKQYLDAVVTSEKVFRTGVQKIPYLKSYELNTGTQSYSVKFSGAKTQFNWLEVSLVYDKKDAHNVICNSYIIELASTYVRSLFIENALQTYSLSNEMKYDTNNKHDQCNLYRQFVAWSCNGCSVTPLTDYANNEIFRGFPKQDDFFTTSDETLYLDLRTAKGCTGKLEQLTREDRGITLKITLKDATTTKKMKLKVWGYLQGEYSYVLAPQGLTMRYKRTQLQKKMILQVN